MSVPTPVTLWKQEIATFLAIALSYFLAGHLAIRILRLGVEASPLWPAAGIALGSLLIRGIQYWPAIFLSSFSLALSLQVGWDVAPGPAIASTLQAAIGAILLRRSGFQLNLARLRDVFGLIVWGVALSPTIGATVSTLAGLLSGLVTRSEILPNWATLWLGDAMGILMVVPLFTLWESRNLDLFQPQTFKAFLLNQTLRRNFSEYPQSNNFQRRVMAMLGTLSTKIWSSQTLFLGLTALVSWAVFGWHFETNPAIAHYPLEYLPLPFLVWAALRFGQGGAVLTSFLISSLAILGTLNAGGPFLAKAETATQAVILLQAFMGVIAIIALMLAAAVTERDQAEAQLRRNNASLEEQIHQRTLELEQKMVELERLNQIKGLFLETVSHNLCTTVMGHSMLLKTLLKKPGEQIPVARKVLEQMLQASDRNLTRLNLLKEVTDVEGQGISLYRQSLQLNLFIEEILLDWEPRLQENQATLTLELPLDLPWINADSAQLRRVFDHLLCNALRHNPPGVHLTLGARIEPRPQAHSDQIQCYLNDDGLGIPDHKLAHLFELYVPDCTQDRLTGSRLGLYLCRQIIRASGGEIGVNSTLGSGSSFWFTLPIAENWSSLKEG